MKFDGENAYVLFACNLHKERNSMRMIAVAADKVTLYAIPMQFCKIQSLQTTIGTECLMLSAFAHHLKVS